MDKSEIFLECVELDRVEKAKSMIENGETDINVLDDYNQNALLIALENQNFELADYFIEKGINVRQKNHGRDNALIICCREGYVEIAKKLIKKGADLEADNDFGETPVAVAASNSQNEILKCLVQAGAKINRIEKMNGFTPIICAVYNKNVEGARILLENGAKASIRSNCKRSVLDFLDTVIHKEEMKKEFLDVFVDYRRQFDDKDREYIRNIRFKMLYDMPIEENK